MQQCLWSQNLKSAGFTKTQKSRYLEKETLFFLQIKKFINYTPGATLWQRIVLHFQLMDVSVEVDKIFKFTIYKTVLLFQVKV